MYVDLMFRQILIYNNIGNLYFICISHTFVTTFVRVGTDNFNKILNSHYNNTNVPVSCRIFSFDFAPKVSSAYLMDMYIKLTFLAYNKRTPVTGAQYRSVCLSGCADIDRASFAD